MTKKKKTLWIVLAAVAAVVGMFFVSCEEKIEEDPSNTDIIENPAIWGTSVSDYSISFTMLDSNWVHCDVYNNSDYRFFFSDNSNYKYELYEEYNNNIISIIQQKDSSGLVTNIANEIYLIDRISEDSIVMRYGGVQPAEPCELCVDVFYLHKIQ